MHGATGELNGVSMRDYVYAAWYAATANWGQTGPQQQSAGKGARREGREGGRRFARFIMPNAYVHYLFIK